MPHRLAPPLPEVRPCPGTAVETRGQGAPLRAERIDLSQLRSFVTVASERHMTHAAERLHLSQPAVSGHIKALEHELGVMLFDRASGGLSLTRAGEALLERAEKVLAAATDLLEQARVMSGEVVARVRLGTIIDPEFLRLGYFLRSMLERHPLIGIETHHGISGWVRDSVLHGELDAGFALGEQSEPALGVVELTRVTYRIVGPPGWKREIDAAGWSEAAAMPWVWTTAHSSHNRIVSEMFGERGLAMTRRVIVADQEATMKSLVMAGVGLSLMREDLAFAAADAGEVVIWKRFRRQIPLSFLHPAARGCEPTIAAMVAVVKDVWSVR